MLAFTNNKKMKIIQSDVIDIGNSFGVDDDFFADSKVKEVFKKHFQKVSFPDERSDFFEQDCFSNIEFPIGKGVKIDLQELDVKKFMLKNAIKSAQENYENESNDLIKIIKKLKVLDDYLIFYSIGLFVQRTTYEIPNDCIDNLGKILNCFYESIDYKNEDESDLYEKKITDFKSELLKISSPNEIIELTKRELWFEGQDTNFIIVDHTVDISKVNKHLSYEFSKIKHKIEIYGNAILYWGYVFSAIQLDDEFETDYDANSKECLPLKEHRDYYDRYIYLSEVMNLYATFVNSLEVCVDTKLSEIVKKNIFLDADEDYIKSINILKIYILATVNLTDYSSLGTIQADDIRLMEIYDKYSKLTKYQEKILQTCTLFVEVQNDFRNIQNDLRAKKSEMQQNKLNEFIFYLTSLTFVSVLSDVISTTDFANQLISSSILRFFILAIPTLLVVVIIRKIINNRSEK